MATAAPTVDVSKQQADKFAAAYKAQQPAPALSVGGAVAANGQQLDATGAAVGKANAKDVTTPAANTVPDAQPAVPAPGATNAATINTSQPSPTTANATPFTGGLTSDQAMQNIAASGYTPPTSTDSGTMAQYQKAQAALKNTPLPSDNGTAKGMAADAIKSNTPAKASTPATDNFFQDNKGVQDIAQSTIDFLSPPSERDTLQKHLDTLNTDKTALVGLKTELMDVKRVMAGTEQDIRDEITKANGFATNSQVMALTVARNRSLQTRATFLQDQVQSQQDLVANDTSLVGEDKQMASQGFTQRMSLLNYQQKNNENMLSAAKSGLDAVVKAAGYAGLYASVKDDPTQVSRDEKVLGLAPGGLAQLATTPDLANTKTKLEIQKLQNEVTGGSGLTLNDYVTTSSQGNKYVDLSTVTDKAEKKAVENNARAQGLPVLTDANVGKMNAIEDTRTNLDNIENQFEKVGYSNGFTKAVGGLGFGLSNRVADLFGSTNVGSFNAWRTAAINSIQALAGGTGSGLRINQAEIDAAMKNDIPNLSDTVAVGKAKMSVLKSQLDSWEKILTGSKNRQEPTGKSGQSSAQNPLGI